MMKNKCWNIGDRKFELSDLQAVVVVASHVVVGLPAAFDDQNVVAASLVAVVSAVIDVQTFVVVVACGVADFVDGVLAVVVAAAPPGVPVVIDLQAGVGSLVGIFAAVVVDDGVAVVVGLAVVSLAAIPVVQTLRYQLFDVDDSCPLILMNLGSGCCKL